MKLSPGSRSVEHVFLVVDGPNCVNEAPGSNVGSPNINLDTLRQHLYQAYQDGEEVIFRVMSGLACADIRDKGGALEIEPLLLTPVPATVIIKDISNEVENPYGVAIFAQVQDIVAYENFLPGTLISGIKIPLLKEDDLIQLSYSLEQNTGGFIKIVSPFAEDNPPPLINSRCELSREFAGFGNSCRGRSLYKASNTRHELPATHTLRLFTVTTP